MWFETGDSCRVACRGECSLLNSSGFLFGLRRRLAIPASAGGETPTKAEVRGETNQTDPLKRPGSFRLAVHLTADTDPLLDGPELPDLCRYPSAGDDMDRHSS